MFWESRLGKTLRHAMHGVLLILIVAMLTSFWFPHRHQSDPQTPAVAVPQAPAVNFDDAIAAAHLFGQAQSPVAGVSQATTSITVVGIVYATQPDNSQAVLTVNGKTDIYKAGENLPDGETLAAIGLNAVQLASGSATRQLLLNMTQFGSEGTSSPSVQEDFAALPATAPGTQSFGTLPISPSVQLTAPGSGRAVQVSATATPLEQLRALRAQLIH